MKITQHEGKKEYHSEMFPNKNLNVTILFLNLTFKSLIHISLEVLK